MQRVTIYTEPNKPRDLSQTPENWLMDYQAANIFTKKRPNSASLPELCVQSLFSPENRIFFTAARLEEIEGNKVLLSALMSRDGSGVMTRAELFYILLQ